METDRRVPIVDNSGTGVINMGLTPGVVSYLDNETDCGRLGVHDGFSIQEEYTIAQRRSRTATQRLQRR